jgi:Trk K+ transport system NAD-binding subunit/nucleotide-binding universal stress UspA family protein
MRLIVVGAGSAARALMRRVGERWDVAVVDREPDRLERIASIRPVETLVGDGTRTEVLEEAGIGTAAAVVAATGDDGVNLAVCRAAAERGIVATAVAADPEGLDAYRVLDVPAISPDRITAGRILSALEPRRVFSAPFASGLMEGLDFRVSPDSPLRGRALRDLAEERWLIVTVLRNGRLIVPHGDTVLEAGDLVTVVGEHADHARIVEAFTSGVARFPTDCGTSVGVAVTGGDDPVTEAAGLAAMSAADSVTLFHRTGEAALSRARSRLAEAFGGLEVRTQVVRGSPGKAALWWPLDGTVGVVVVPARSGRGSIGRREAARACRAAARLARPVLFSRGSAPYTGILVPARDTPAGRAAARAAIDLGAHTGLPLTAVVVVPPLFIAGDEARREAARSAARLQEEAAIHGIAVRRVIEQGNPVRIVEGLVDRRSLLVLGLMHRRPTVIAPGILGHLVRRARCSVLVVPRGD